MIVLHHICKTVILSVKNPCDLSFQIQILKQRRQFHQLSSFFPTAEFYLGRCYQINQNLLSLHCLSHQKMTQIPLVTQLVIVLCSLLLIEFQHCFQNLTKVFINDLTIFYCHNIIKAATLMHSQRQWSILIFVSKGKFHLIAVSKLTWTCLDSFKFIGFTHWIQKCFHLADLQLQLLLIWKILVGTSTTVLKMWTCTFDLFL